MNQKELNEIRRRFKPDRTAISKVYGCYVSSSRQIISYVDAPLGLLSQEEQEMYLNLLKKSLSGALGRNLIDIEFSTRQVADSDEHRLLQTLRQTECKDANARETLCRKIKLQRKILRMLDMHHINVKCQQDLFIDLSHLFIMENRKLRCFANFKFQGDHIFVRVDRQS